MSGMSVHGGGMRGDRSAHVRSRVGEAQVGGRRALRNVVVPCSAAVGSLSSSSSSSLSNTSPSSPLWPVHRNKRPSVSLHGDCVVIEQGGHKRRSLVRLSASLESRQGDFSQQIASLSPSDPDEKAYYRRGQRITFEEKQVRKPAFGNATWEAKLLHRINGILPFDQRSRESTSGRDDAETEAVDEDETAASDRYYDEAIDAAFKDVAQGREQHMPSRVVTTLLKQIHRFELSLKVFRFLQKRAFLKDETNNVWSFGTLIMKCSKNGLWADAKELLNEMMSLGLKPPDLTLSCVMTSCRKVGRHEDVRAIFEMAVETKCAGDDTFGCMMISNNDVGRYKENVAILADIWSLGLTPLPRHYTYAIFANKELNNVDGAVRLLDEMEKKGVRVTNKVLGALLYAAIRTGDYQIAMVMMTRAKGLGVVPSTSNYRLLAMCLHNAAQKDLVDAVIAEMVTLIKRPDFDWFNLRESTYAVSAFQYYTEPAQAMFVYEKLKSMNLLKQADDRFFCAMFAALDAAGDIEAARRVFDDVKSFGMKMNDFMYTAFLTAVSKGPNSRATAMAVMEDMRSEGVAPHCSTYSSFLIAFEKRRNERIDVETEKNDCGVVFRVRNEMLRSKVDMSFVVWSQLIGILWDRGMYTESVKMVLEAEKRGIKLVRQWCQQRDEYDMSSANAADDNTATVIDFHGLTPGAVSACLCLALLRFRRNPTSFSPYIHILTGRGKHSAMKSWRGISLIEVIELWMSSKGLPIQVQRLPDGKMNVGRFECTNDKLLEWVRSFDSADFIHAVALDHRDCFSAHEDTERDRGRTG